MEPRVNRWLALACLATSLGMGRAAPRPQTADFPTTASLITLTGTAEYTPEVPEPTLVTLTGTREPTVTDSGSASTATGDACARLAELVQDSGADSPIVPAEAAWECLQAVPFDPDTAEDWLDSLRPYIRWQSTLAYLRNPPEEYPLPAYDVYEAFDQVVSTVQDEGYSNQYEFEFAIYSIFQRAHDGHLTYLPNMVAEVASFGRPFALVAVSADGEQTPRPYVYSDVVLSYNDTGFEPSPITAIDGEEVNTYLENFSLNGPLHDLDSLWNNLFLNLAAVSLGPYGTGPGVFSGGGRGSFLYPNASTTLTFENGTSTTFQNGAQLLVPFADITSAQDLYQGYVNRRTLPQPMIQTFPDFAPPPGYPAPVIRNVLNLASGYFLEGDEYDDVAVLSLPSFLPSGGAPEVAYSFLDQAKTAGKTKLIIDLSANGGGAVQFGFALFVKLFPNMVPYLGTRFRATESLDVIGQIVSEYSNGTANRPFVNGNEQDPLALIFNGFTPFPYASDVDVDYEPFPDWQTKFGPYQYNGDNFTSIIRWNFSQPAAEVNVEELTSGTGPLFEPENIVLLTDGYCASTCSNFVEFMTNQAGVKTVSIGGRPTNNGTIQVSGGTRGANVYTWFDILTYVNLTASIVLETQPVIETANLYLNTELGEYLGRGSNPLLPFVRAGLVTSSVNSRDNIAEGDDEQIPLQFQYQGADCRLYYTPDMTVDISAVWTEVVDVSWGDGSCVWGSVQDTNSQRKKRGAKERTEKRRLQRRALTVQELDRLVDGVNIRTDHHGDMSGGGLMLP